MNAHIDPEKAGSTSKPVTVPTPAQLPISRISQPTIVASVLASDAAIVFVSGLITGGSWLQASQFHWTALVAVALAAAALTLTGLRKNWAYTIPSLSGLTRQLAFTGIWLFAAMSAVIVVSFLAGIPDTGMKLWLAYWYASGWGMLALSRITLSFWLKKQSRAGTLARRTVIAGGGDAAETLI